MLSDVIPTITFICESACAGDFCSASGNTPNGQDDENGRPANQVSVSCAPAGRSMSFTGWLKNLKNSTCVMPRVVTSIFEIRSFRSFPSVCSTAE